MSGPPAIAGRLSALDDGQLPTELRDLLYAQVTVCSDAAQART